MSTNYDPSRAINGVWGQYFIDGEEIPEATGIETESAKKKTEVLQVGTLETGQKATGVDNKGTLKMNHVNSYLKNMILDEINTGKTGNHTIVSQEADPDTLDGQVESYQYTGVDFDSVKPQDWEAGKLDEISIPFTYRKCEPLASIKR